MTTIRPFERADVPEVTSLYEYVSRSGTRAVSAGLDEYFERMFFEHPWSDPEIPSLVYLDESGAVAGFIGSSVRRLAFAGQTIRMAVAGQLVTDPKVRSRAAGAFLLKSYLAGPQDLTITDTASETVRRLWERLGGETLHLGCIGWLRVFRPLRFAGDFAARRGYRARAWTSRRLARPLDALARQALPRQLRAPEPRGSRGALTPSELVEHLPTIARSLLVRPDYDTEFAEWLLRELAAVRTHGTLAAHLVRDDVGDVLGWYVYYRQTGDIGSVLQVAGRDGAVDSVLDHLFHDAASNGVAALQGRLEGPLREPLSRKDCLLHPSGYLALVHSPRPDLLHALQSGRALLTRMEGEWWMGHHLYPFD